MLNSNGTKFLPYGLLVVIFAALLFKPLHAGMNVEQYLPPPSVIESDEARQRVEKQIEHERKQAEILQQQQAAEREAESLKQEMERQQRPFAVKLVEQRCLTCHTPDVLEQQSRSLLHWALVVQRMHRLNGAPLESGDTLVIAKHLAQQSGVSPLRTLVEYFVLALVILVFLGVIWRSINLIKRKGKA